MIAVTENGFTPFGRPVAIRGIGQTEERPPDFKARPGRRVAWGRLKKADAQELLAIVDEAIEGLERRGIPPGILKAVEAKLADFVVSAPADAEIELSPEETQAVEEALFLVEGELPSRSIAPLLIVGAVGVTALVLLV